MTAIAALTLADGQATPANHTFSPVKVDAAGVAKWVDRSGGIALGYPTITLSMREPTKGSRNYRVTRKIVIPVLEVTSPSTSTGIQPAPTLAFNMIQNTEWVLPERSTLAQRNDLIAYAKNFDANAVLTESVKNFETVY